MAKKRAGAATDPAELPVHPEQAESLKARESLMKGEDLDLLVFRWSTDMRRPDQVERLEAELKRLRSKIPLPADGGIHYLFFVTTDGQYRPALIPEMYVPWVVTGVGLAVGVAEQVQHELGILP